MAATDAKGSVGGADGDGALTLNTTRERHARMLADALALFLRLDALHSTTTGATTPARASDGGSSSGGTSSNEHRRAWEPLNSLVDGSDAPPPSSPRVNTYARMHAQQVCAIMQDIAAEKQRVASTPNTATATGTAPAPAIKLDGVGDVYC
ncbi:hypothetical protein GQ42DRAFT_161940, partial [Ramicandelaber brevisporus]